MTRVGQAREGRGAGLGGEREAKHCGYVLGAAPDGGVKVLVLILPIVIFRRRVFLKANDCRALLSPALGT